MSYSKINWENSPSTNTPINATNLNKMDTQIKQNADDIEEINTTLFNLIYPIGSIYETSDAAFDPNTSFGGTWIKIEGKFLLASSEDYTLGDTGGEATHTLTIQEMPSHTHTPSSIIHGNSEGITTGSAWSEGIYTRSTSGTNLVLNNTGGGQAFSIMPPYEVVNVWKRTA